MIGLTSLRGNEPKMGAPCDETPDHVSGAVCRGVSCIEFSVYEAGHYCGVGDVTHWGAVHPPVKVSVVVRENLLASLKHRFDGAALLHERGVVIGVWVGGTISWAPGEGACAGVP